MSFSHRNADRRQAQYGRLVMNVLNALNDAVNRRVSEGESKSSIADRIGCHRSQLSRTLNGNVPNLTIKTISDILWATDHEPRDFGADACEMISSNFVGTGSDLTNQTRETAVTGANTRPLGHAFEAIV